MEQPAAEVDSPERAAALLRALARCVAEVSTAEFATEDVQFDSDSWLGRQMLHLLASDNWIRGTLEAVELQSATSIATAVRLDLDLATIVHEAYEREERLALPLLVLPTPPDGNGLAPDVTVLDENGATVPVRPRSEVTRQVAMGVSDIFLALIRQRVAAAGLTLDRDARIVLGLGIQRLLREGVPDDDRPGPAAEPRAGSATQRVATARRSILTVVEMFARRVLIPTALNDDRIGTVFTCRASAILRSLSRAHWVVVGAERRDPQRSLTVFLPARGLAQHGFSWVRFRGGVTLHLDLLLASARTDRQVRLQLPEGVSCLVPDGPDVHCGIAVDAPRAVEQLRVLVGQLVAVLPHTGVTDGDRATVTCLAQLAASRLELVREGLSDYRSADDSLRGLRAALARLAEPIGRLGGDTAFDPESWRTTRAELHAAWDDGRAFGPTLHRAVSVQAPSGREALLRADGLPDAEQQGVMRSATVRVGLSVVGHPLRGVSVLATTVGLLLIGGVLAFQTWGTTAGRPLDAQVLSGVLTLFAAVQASRMQQPDRSTLHGLMASVGYLAIVASILPMLGLAMSLAFRPVSDHPLIPCLIAFGLQTALLAALTVPGSRRKRSGPELRAGGTVDHRAAALLRAPWWATATGDALLLGRPLYPYVASQTRPPAAERPGDDSGGSLAEVVSVATSDVPAGRRRMFGGPRDVPADDTPQDGSANLLALLRSVLGPTALNFLVFGERPADTDVNGGHHQAVDHDPERIVTRDTSIFQMWIFLGWPAGTPPTHRDRALRTVLTHVGNHDLWVDDVRLPCVRQPETPPADGEPDLTWARIRVAIRHNDLENLSGFLLRLADLPAPEPFALLVEAQVGYRGAWFRKPPAPTPRRHPAPGVRIEWFVGALTAEAGPGVEARVLRRIADLRGDLHVAEVTTAALRGFAVVFVLVGQRAGTGLTRAELTGALQQDEGLRRMGVTVHHWQPVTLGARPRPEPLVSVDTRSLDARGGLVAITQAVDQSLGDPDALQVRLPGRVPKLPVPYALVRFVEGGRAQVVLHVRPDEQLLRGSEQAVDQRLRTAEQLIRAELRKRVEHTQYDATTTAALYALDATVVRVERAEGRRSPDRR